MRITTTLAAAAALSVSAVAANAGGLGPTGTTDVVIAAPQEIMTPAPTGSINPAFIVLGLLGALVAAGGSF